MKEGYIKYKRVVKTFNPNDENLGDKIQEYLDSLIGEGFEIISYDEKESSNSLDLKLLLGKKRQVL